MAPGDLFRQCEDTYYVHKGRLDAGRITREQFETEIKSIRVEDTADRFWTLSMNAPTWRVYQNGGWATADPYAVEAEGKRLVPSAPAYQATTIIPLPDSSATRPAVAPPTYPAYLEEASRASTVVGAAASIKSGSTAPTKKRGCFATGCQVSLAGLVLVAGVAALLYFRIPQQLGVLPSPQTVFADTPDRETAQALVADLTKAGVATKGMNMVVFPFRNNPGSVAIAVLEAGKGFKFKSGSKDPFIDLFKQIAASPAMATGEVKRISMSYRNLKGTTLLDLTASTDSVQSYASGRLNRVDFLKATDGQANWIALALDQLKQ